MILDEALDIGIDEVARQVADLVMLLVTQGMPPDEILEYLATKIPLYSLE